MLNCSACTLKLSTGDVQVLRPCGHLLHSACSNHLRKMPSQSGKPFCPRCQTPVRGTIGLFLDESSDASASQTAAKEEAQESELLAIHKLQDDHCAAGVAFAKAKKQYSDLSSKCAQLHDRKKSLEQSLEKQLRSRKSLFPGVEVTSATAEHQGQEREDDDDQNGLFATTSSSATFAEVEDMDVTSLQLYLLQSGSQSDDLSKQLSMSTSELELLERKYKLLKAKKKMKLQKRKAREEGHDRIGGEMGGPMPLQSQNTAVASQNDEIRPKMVKRVEGQKIAAMSAPTHSSGLLLADNSASAADEGVGGGESSLSLLTVKKEGQEGVYSTAAPFFSEPVGPSPPVEEEDTLPSCALSQQENTTGVDGSGGCVRYIPSRTAALSSTQKQKQQQLALSEKNKSLQQKSGSSLQQQQQPLRRQSTTQATLIIDVDEEPSIIDVDESVQILSCTSSVQAVSPAKSRDSSLSAIDHSEAGPLLPSQLATPLVPVQHSSGKMPRMGLREGRSLFDLPKRTDTMHQATLSQLR